MVEEKSTENINAIIPDEKKASPTAEILNSQVSLVIGTRVIQIWRISVETLEIATATIIKFMIVFQPGAAIYNMINKNDIAVLRQIIAACSSLGEEEMKTMPLVDFLKIMDKWLELNENELVEASKLFLVIRGRLEKLGQSTLPKKG